MLFLVLLFRGLVILATGCRTNADSSGDPQDSEVIELTESARISFPEERGLKQTKSWKFKSSSNEPIYLRCDLGLKSPSDNGECASDKVTVVNGESILETCGSRPLSLVSSKGEITMTVDLFPSTEGHLDCEAGVVVASDPEEAGISGLEMSPEGRTSDGTKKTTCPCGSSNKNYERVHNGTETSEGEYPFMVSLRRKGWHTCGASIISPHHVLTAAHCVIKRGKDPEIDLSNLEAFVGAHHISEDASHGQTKAVKVKEAHAPPEWYDKPDELIGDIAVLVLEEPIQYNDYVSPVCLSPEPLPIVDKNIKALGWGEIENGETPCVLRHADVLVVDPDSCHQDEHETCFKHGPSTTCFGDSGGPYVYADPETNRYIQAAVVSYVYGHCAGPLFVGTNAIFYHSWIQETVKKTSESDVCIKEN